MAICVKNNRPQAFGVNKFRHLKHKSTFLHACHAEMDLLRKLGPKADGSRLFLYRFNNTTALREPRCAKPCPLCQHELKAAGVSRVHYLDDDGNEQILRNRDFLTLVGSPSNITKHFLARVHEPRQFDAYDYVKAA